MLISKWLEDAKRPPDVRHVDTCDGLRALAILIVGWFHIWQQSWLYPELVVMGRSVSFDPLVRSGYMWVDMMILISGFCLYLPWARAAREGGPLPDTADFYVRRLARIHPSYLLTIAVMFAVALATNAYYTQQHMLRDVLAHLTYTHTLFYDTYYATHLGGSLWTLAIEMQFYLIFPLLARAFLRFPVATFACMTGGSLALRAYIGAQMADVSLYFNQLPAYLDTFALGMAAAAIHAALAERRRGPLSRIVCSLLVVPVCVMLWRLAGLQASCSGTEAIRIGQMNHRLAMGILSAALLLFTANAGLLVRRVFSNPLMRFVSSVSMQFYIWHQTLAVWILQLRLIPSDAVNPNYEGDRAWQLAYTAACFLIAFAVSAALTYGFERPISRRLMARWITARAGKKQDKRLTEKGA